MYRLKYLVLLLLVILLIFLPPYREEDDWSNQTSSKMATGGLKTELNRKAFGLLPEYHFFGFRRTVFHEGDVQFNTLSGTYLLTTSETKIDKSLYGLQILSLLLAPGYLLFKARSLKSKNDPLATTSITPAHPRSGNVGG